MSLIDYEIKEIDSTSTYWPSDVKGITKLWCAGNLELLKKPSVSIVGTRHPSEKGRERTKRIVDALGPEYVITSGLALGIDGTAHLQALSKGFETIAVLGTPIDCFYPSEHEKLQKIIAEKGLVVSQFETGSMTKPYCFMKRNLLMSQISRFTVLVESSDSGGGVGQARYTAKQGKSVVVFSDVYLDKSLTWPQSIPEIVVVSSEEKIISEVNKANIPVQMLLFQ